MEKYSFEDLVDNSELGFKNIVIPKIQRDYVQGSIDFENDKPVLNSKGKRFIDALFSFIANESVNEFTLDFVYGSIKNESFYPLDGQQRLTTIYLLYWYTAVYDIAGVDVKKRYLAFLSHFSYETRTSSNDFCKLLCQIDNIKNKEVPPSKYIRSLTHFHSSYELDPTITAMLSMLDAIDTKYKEMKANNTEVRLSIRIRRIKFYLLPLDNYKLDEELYVKMNARGKVLTDYENFKADFVSWMKSDVNPFKEQLYAVGRFNRPKYLEIASALDNEWSDVVFKKHRDDFDLSFFKLVARWFISCYLVTTDFSSKSNREILDDAFIKEFTRYYSNVSNENIYTSFDSFKAILESDPSGKVLSDFVRFMRNASSNDFVLNDIHASWETDAFDLSNPSDSTQSDITIFLGIFLYLNKVDQVDEEEYKHWVRFVFNSVRGTDIDSWRAALSVIVNMATIASTTVDIDGYFSTINQNAADSFVKAVKHEYKKSLYVSSDEDWRNLFITAESNKFLRNDINVLMSDGMTKDVFSKRLFNLSSVFDDKGLNQSLVADNPHIIIQAAIKHLPYAELIRHHLYDTDDKEEHLKKTLSDDNAFTNQIRHYLDLDDRNSILLTLQSDIQGNSPIVVPNLGPDDPSLAAIQNAHKTLYSSNVLYDYLANEKMLYILVDEKHVCSRFSYGNKNSVIVEIDSNRDQLFDALSAEGFRCNNNIITCENNKFYVGREIVFEKQMPSSGNMVKLIFNLNGRMRVTDADMIELHSFDINYYNTQIADTLTVIRDYFS